MMVIKYTYRQFFIEMLMRLNQNLGEYSFRVIRNSLQKYEIVVIYFNLVFIILGQLLQIKI